MLVIINDDHDHEDSSQSIWQRLIINHKGLFFQIWYSIYVMLCFLSSYIYGYKAAFETLGSWATNSGYIAESFFWLNLLIMFLVDYIKPGTG